VLKLILFFNFGYSAYETFFFADRAEMWKESRGVKEIEVGGISASYAGKEKCDVAI